MALGEGNKAKGIVVILVSGALLIGGIVFFSNQKHKIEANSEGLAGIEADVDTLREEQRRDHEYIEEEIRLNELDSSEVTGSNSDNDDDSEVADVVVVNPKPKRTVVVEEVVTPDPVIEKSPGLVLSGGNRRLNGNSEEEIKKWSILEGSVYHSVNGTKGITVKIQTSLGTETLAFYEVIHGRAMVGKHGAYELCDLHGIQGIPLVGNELRLIKGQKVKLKYAK